jgi:tRNA modification GTPase
MKTNTDTIAAISTALGSSGISIIRISGEAAFEIAEKLYAGKKKKFSQLDNRALSYGHITKIDSGNIIDEVLISKMKAPYTYTAEDVVEINCHGGLTVASEVLQEVIRAGARLAEPGEFTKRAFLNGRIDLIQAEAIMDIINAKSSVSLDAAQNRLRGHLSNEINEIKDVLLNILSYIGVGIEYPEYDVEESDEENIRMMLKDAKDKLTKLYLSSKRGQILNDGLKVAIVGKPNAGKSMLLNALTNQERSIVTEIPGTTRDIVSEFINIGGIPVKIIDTAGIRKSENKVEQIGIQRSIQAINEAQAVIFVLDSSRKWDSEDEQIFSLLEEKDTIFVANKSDLQTDESIKKRLDGIQLHFISALKKEGLDEIEKKIESFASLKSEDVLSEAIAANIRQENLLKSALESLDGAVENLNLGLEIDMVEIDIKDCLQSLAEITGQAIGEDIIDRIFANFCLGK